MAPKLRVPELGETKAPNELLELRFVENGGHFEAQFGGEFIDFVAAHSPFGDGTHQRAHGRRSRFVSVLMVLGDGHCDGDERPLPRQKLVVFEDGLRAHFVSFAHDFVHRRHRFFDDLRLELLFFAGNDHNE